MEKDKKVKKDKKIKKVMKVKKDKKKSSAWSYPTPWDIIESEQSAAIYWYYLICLIFKFILKRNCSENYVFSLLTS